MKIDSHHHFWRYTPEEYGWIDDSMKLIRRDFLPDDLNKELALSGINGVISVQARTSLKETQWLLDLASQNPWIYGVVGWVDLCNADIERTLQDFSKEKKLKSIRHVLQSESNDFFIKKDFNQGLSFLKNWGFAYDLLITEGQICDAIDLVDRHPDQAFILDHIAKPRIREGILDPWRKNISELAKRTNVSCKISGMVTEDDYQNWTTDSLKPYFDIVLEAFGPDRLLFGSDWPVCLVASGYLKWKETIDSFLLGLSVNDQEKIYGLNAQRIYKL